MSETYNVEAIWDYDASKKLFLVKWENYPEENNTWEPLKNLTSVQQMIDEFFYEKDRKEKRIPKKSSLFKVDDRIKGCTPAGWFAGKIILKRYDRIGKKFRYKVRWDDYDDKFDEWIDEYSIRSEKGGKESKPAQNDQTSSSSSGSGGKKRTSTKMDEKLSGNKGSTPKNDEQSKRRKRRLSKLEASTLNKAKKVKVPNSNVDIKKIDMKKAENLALQFLLDNQELVAQNKISRKIIRQHVERELNAPENSLKGNVVLTHAIDRWRKLRKVQRRKEKEKASRHPKSYSEVSYSEVQVEMKGDESASRVAKKKAVQSKSERESNGNTTSEQQMEDRVSASQSNSEQGSNDSIEQYMEEGVEEEKDQQQGGSDDTDSPKIDVPSQIKASNGDYSCSSKPKISKQNFQKLLKENQELKDTIGNLEAAIDGLQEKMKELEYNLGERHKTIESLSHKVKDMKQIQTEYNNLKGRLEGSKSTKKLSDKEERMQDEAVILYALMRLESQKVSSSKYRNSETGRWDVLKMRRIIQGLWKHDLDEDETVS